MIALFDILEGITPNYLSDLFVKADTPYDNRRHVDKFRNLKFVIYPRQVKRHDVKHRLKLLIVCDKYGKNPPRKQMLYNAHYKMCNFLQYFLRNYSWITLKI